MTTFKRYVFPFGAGLFAVLLIVILQGALGVTGLENSAPLNALLNSCVLLYFYGVVKKARPHSQTALLRAARAI